MRSPLSLFLVSQIIPSLSAFPHNWAALSPSLLWWTPLNSLQYAQVSLLLGVPELDMVLQCYHGVTMLTGCYQCCGEYSLITILEIASECESYSHLIPKQSVLVGVTVFFVFVCLLVLLLWNKQTQTVVPKITVQRIFVSEKKLWIKVCFITLCHYKIEKREP